LSIPESEARCNNCGEEPSSEDEWIIGIVETSFCKTFMAISFKLSYGPACIIKEYSKRVPYIVSGLTV